MKNRYSLRNILLVSYIFAAVVPILALGLIELNISLNAIGNEIVTKNNILAGSAEREIEKFLSYSESHLMFIVGYLDNGHVLADNYKPGNLDLLIENYGFFESIQILDLNGRIIDVAPYNPELIGFDQSRQDFFRIPAERGVNFWSEVFIAEYNNQPTVSLSIPMEHGIVAGYFNLDELSSIISGIKIGENGSASITDSTGTIIADKDRDKISQKINISNLEPIKEGLRGNPGVYNYYSDDSNENYIGTVSIVDPINWVVLVSQPENEAFMLVSKTQMFLGVFIIIALVLAISVSFFSLNLAVRPFSYFLRSAKAIAEGQYSDIEFPRSYREIGELAFNFTSMAGAIMEREQQLKESEERYKTLFEKYEDGIIVTDDSRQKFLYLNPAISGMLGYTHEEMIGMKLPDIHPEEIIKAVLERFSSADAGKKPPAADLPCLAKSGRIVSMDIRITPIMINKKKCYICIYRDITERKVIEKLETEKLLQEKMLLKVQRSAMLGELTSALAHEIRQPLHTIRIIAEGLIIREKNRDAESAEDDAGLRNLSTIIRGIERIDGVVDNIYGHTNQTQDIIIEPVNLNHVIAEIIDFYKVKLNYHKIEIEFQPDPGDPVVVISKIQAEQVITNLLSNAIKALDRSDRSRKKISIKTLKTGNSLFVEISDNGPGIAGDMKEKIFWPLFTLNRDRESLGMGLYLVRNILETFHAGIEVSDNESGGSVFSIKFNVTEEAYEYSDNR